MENKIPADKKNKGLKKSKELGASLVEYGLLIALIAVVGIPAVQAVGRDIDSKLKEAKEGLGAATVVTVGACDPFSGPCPPVN